MINLTLGNKTIYSNCYPYIIAEIGVNHEGSMDRAKQLIDLAKQGGADAVKFQSYKADTLASKNSPAYWDKQKEPTESQHKLFKKYDKFEQDDFLRLSEYSKKIGIEFLSTPFDDLAIEFLNPIVPFYKIASADITNIPFLRKIAKKNKPILLSTGASTLEEINIAIDELVKANCKREKIVLLHCILNYPTININARLNMIKGLINKYPKHLIGYSDHTLPDQNMTSLVTAYLLGAVVIEKHFTDDKSLKGNDHYHAMDVNDLINFKTILSNIESLIGPDLEKKPIESEEIARQNARRSIVLKRNVKAGHYLKANDITYKRPGTGVSPLHWDEVLGSRVLKNLEADHVLMWNDIKKI